MSNDQVLVVHMLLGELKDNGATQATHGMCIGSDETFHRMAKAMAYFVIGVPGVTVFGKEWKRSTQCGDCDLIMPAKPFLLRNRDIVRESDVMIATPSETVEQRKGSGTWATIRYTREAKKPLVLVWTDGTGVVENVPGVTTVQDYRNRICQSSPLIG